MTLGRDYEGQPVVGWDASEKLDGCRAYWDGAALWTRGGNEIHAPDWFRRDLPAHVHLEGEVYAGRGMFTEARLAVQHGRFTRRCRFVAFDAPEVDGPWIKRIGEAARHVEAVSPWRVESKRQLACKLDDVLSGGGEGLMLRNPGVVEYERGRTASLLKLKSLAQLF